MGGGVGDRVWCIAVALRGDRGLERALSASNTPMVHCGRSSGRSRIGTVVPRL